jgi:hypothetical protein
MTMPRSFRLLSSLLFAVLVLAAGSVPAHEYKLDIAMNGFVRIDRDEAHLVIRAPLYLFRTLRFPVKGIEVDVDGAGTALARSVEAIERDVVLLQDGRPLAAKSGRARLTLPSDRSFESYERAVANIEAPIEPGTSIVVDQGYVDAHIVYPIASPGAVFSVRSTAGEEFGDILKVTIRYASADGDGRTIVLTNRSGVVDLNPSILGAAKGFVGFGIAHILTGYDHLLFLLCLVIPLRRVREILAVITGFTIAHSLTLVGSALNLAPGAPWFPPFVETVIAMSVVYMALEAIVGVDFRRRLLLTMLFGLVHGFGFSYGLRDDLQFAGGHLVVALFAFNAGIEIGQLIALAAILPALALVRRFVLPGRVGEVVLAALAAHVGWHWMEDRWQALTKVPWPAPDLAGLSVLLAWLAALAILGGAVLWVVGRLRLDAPAAVAPPRAAR